MTTQICLLRGVNVGGVKVPMAELKAIASGLGWGNPRTLLASGNLVADFDGEPHLMEAALEAALHAHFGRKIDVIIRGPKAWSDLMAANPFPDEAKADHSRLLVQVMKSQPLEGSCEALAGLAQGGEAVAQVPGALYMCAPTASVARSWWKRRCRA
jgi:uncharacterized protein (DUF1697 family)